jgi:hypothetical protein
VLTYVCPVEVCEKNQNGHLRHHKLVELGKNFALGVIADKARFASVMV